MEHAAVGMNMDPLEFRKKNFFKKGDLLFNPNSDKPTYLEEENPMPKIIADLSKSANLVARKAAVEKFNKASIFMTSYARRIIYSTKIVRI